MTKDEKMELGRLLDKHKIKSIFYHEHKKYGVYEIIRRDDNDNDLIENEILGSDLRTWPR